MGNLESDIAGIHLNDRRLDRRAIKLLDDLGGNPSASIPAACGGFGETKAAYRLLANDKVSPEKILMPHIACTVERMKQHPVVLCVQDTTELDFSTKPETQGLGPLNKESRYGLYLHPTLAVTPGRLALGVLGATRVIREPGSTGKKKDKHLPIEDKESIRWLEGYRQISELQRSCPEIQLVYMADREADIFDIYLDCLGAEERGERVADWLVRARFPERILTDGQKLLQKLESCEPLGQVEFDLPSSHERKGGRVTQVIYSARVELQAPYRKGGQRPPVSVTAILAREENPPEGEKAIEWILLSNLAVDDLGTAVKLLEWYLCRWQVEIFFRILKSGCKVEELQLETEGRIANALALYMIIAWRILYLVTLGRECPDLPCDVVFDREEWATAYMVANRKPPPEEPPILSDMILMIAGCGGHLGRKSDGPPGPKSMWIGLQRIRDISFGIELYKELSSCEG